MLSCDTGIFVFQSDFSSSGRIPLLSRIATDSGTGGSAKTIEMQKSEHNSTCIHNLKLSPGIQFNLPRRINRAEDDIVLHDRVVDNKITATVYLQIQATLKI